MRRLSEDDELELFNSGIDIEVNGKHYRPKHKPVVNILQQSEPKVDNELLKSLATIAYYQEINTSSLIKNNNDIVALLNEVTKPKPKKNYICSVSRSSAGLIKTIHVEEK